MENGQLSFAMANTCKPVNLRTSKDHADLGDHGDQSSVVSNKEEREKSTQRVKSYGLCIIREQSATFNRPKAIQQHSIQPTQPIHSCPFVIFHLCSFVGETKSKTRVNLRLYLRKSAGNFLVPCHLHKSRYHISQIDYGEKYANTDRNRRNALRFL